MYAIRSYYGIDVGALDLELFDIGKRRAKIESVGRFIEDLPKRVQHLVDSCSGQ